MIHRYAQVNADGLVVNMVLWDGETQFDSEFLLVKAPDEANIGWGWDGNDWVIPEPPTPEPEPEDPLAAVRDSGMKKLLALGLTKEEALAIVGG
jgi:hypothetical protein